jgi:purine-binding chemotaxis protein CheW
MEAFAKNVTSDMENIESTDKDEIDGLPSNAPLFSSDEIIFPDENTERAYTRYGYQISYMNFLVPEGTVCEVIQNPKIFSLPNAPSWIEGLLNIRGNIIPVMNVGKYLKNGNKEKFTNILVLDKSDNENAIAVMISDLPVSLEISDSKTSTTNYSDDLLEFISAGFKQNGIDWIEFDPQKLFKRLAGKEST